MPKRVHKIEQIGITTEGKIVVNGVFHFYATEGLPLFMVFSLCDQRNMVPCWLTFYRDARENGWKHSTIMNRMQEALRDVYSREFCEVILKRMEFLNEYD